MSHKLIIFWAHLGAILEPNGHPETSTNHKNKPTYRSKAFWGRGQWPYFFDLGLHSGKKRGGIMLKSKGSLDVKTPVVGKTKCSESSGCMTFAVAHRAQVALGWECIKTKNFLSLKREGRWGANSIDVPIFFLFIVPWLAGKCPLVTMDCTPSEPAHNYQAI